jgi:hypothetical protein
MGRPRQLQGYLLSAAPQDLKRETVLSSPHVQFVREIESTRWDEYRFLSRTALHGEEQLPFGDQFEYFVLVRRSGPRALVMAEYSEVLDVILQQERAVESGVRLRRVRIAVDGLAKHIARKPGRYLLSRVDALVPAYGQSLRSVSFYGDDVGEAALFRDHLDHLQIYACGLRETTTRSEVLRLTNRGVVSFRYTGIRRIVEVEKVLGFVRNEGFLDFV